MIAIDYRNQSLQVYPSEIISQNLNFLSQMYVFDSFQSWNNKQLFLDLCFSLFPVGIRCISSLHSRWKRKNIVFPLRLLHKGSHLIALI